MSHFEVDELTSYLLTIYLLTMLLCLLHKQLVYSSNLSTRLLVHSSTFVKIIHRLKIWRALIAFQLTPFGLAKDAL